MIPKCILEFCLVILVLFVLNNIIYLASIKNYRQVLSVSDEKEGEAETFHLRDLKSIESALDFSLSVPNSSSNGTKLSQPSSDNKSIDINERKINLKPDNSAIVEVPLRNNEKNTSLHGLPTERNTQIIRMLLPGESRQKRKVVESEVTEKYRLYPSSIQTGDKSVLRNPFPEDFIIDSIFPSGGIFRHKSTDFNPRLRNKNSSEKMKKIKEPDDEAFGKDSFYFRAADDTSTANRPTMIITIPDFKYPTASSETGRKETSPTQQNKNNSPTDQTEKQLTTTTTITTSKGTKTTTEQEKTESRETKTGTGKTNTEKTETGNTNTEQIKSKMAGILLSTSESGLSTSIKQKLSPTVNYHFHYHYFGVVAPSIDETTTS